MYVYLLRLVIRFLSERSDAMKHTHINRVELDFLMDFIQYQCLMDEEDN